MRRIPSTLAFHQRWKQVTRVILRVAALLAKNHALSNKAEARATSKTVNNTQLNSTMAAWARVAKREVVRRGAVNKRAVTNRKSHLLVRRSNPQREIRWSLRKVRSKRKLSKRSACLPLVTSQIVRYSKALWVSTGRSQSRKNFKAHTHLRQTTRLHQLRTSLLTQLKKISNHRFRKRSQSRLRKQARA
jgi:hypothetical protein